MDAPTIQHVLETALYVNDLDRAVAFYRDVLGLRVVEGGSRLIALDAGHETLVLLCLRGASIDEPAPHDGHGPIHIAFAVSDAQLDRWEAHLTSHGIAVERRVRWSLGGKSLYFRDPDGHLVEMATPGTWPVY